MLLILRYILCFILPPLAVMTTGRFKDFFINIVMWLLFWIPGTIHAVLVVKAYYRDKANYSNSSVRSVLILFESIDLIFNSNNRTTIANRYETIVYYEKDFIEMFNRNDIEKILKETEVNYISMYNKPLSDSALKFIARRVNNSIVEFRKDIYEVYCSNIIRAFNDEINNKINKINSLKTNKSKISNLEKVIEEVRQFKNSFSGTANLEEIINTLDKEKNKLINQ